MEDNKNGFPPPHPEKPQKLHGGIFDSVAWRFPNEKPTTRRSYACAWGQMGVEPERKSIRNTTVTKAIIRARRGHSAHIIAYGDTLAAHAIMSTHKGDCVLVFGQRVQQESFKKKLQTETWDSEIRACVVIVAKHLGLLYQLWDVHEKISIGLPRFLYALWNLPEIQEQAKHQSWWDERPDTWESGDG